MNTIKKNRNAWCKRSKLKSRQQLGAVVLSLMVVLAAVLACACQTGSDGVRISEVMSVNSHTLHDDVLGTPDWIELYNPGRNEVDISGYGLSNETSNLKKFVFPQGTVIPAAAWSYSLVRATSFWFRASCSSVMGS